MSHLIPIPRQSRVSRHHLRTSPAKFPRHQSGAARATSELSLRVASVVKVNPISRYGTRGRFRTGSPCGGGRAPEERTSRLETTVFNVLAFVLSGGSQDVRVPFDGRMNLDMLFEAQSGFRLGIEYDGAYWHAGKRRSDLSKTRRLVDSGLVHELIRVREDPLDLLGPLDLSVRHGSSGLEVAQSTILHLHHTVADAFGSAVVQHVDYQVFRIRSVVNMDQIRCDDCLKALSRP